MKFKQITAAALLSVTTQQLFAPVRIRPHQELHMHGPARAPQPHGLEMHPQVHAEVHTIIPAQPTARAVPHDVQQSTQKTNKTQIQQHEPSRVASPGAKPAATPTIPVKPAGAPVAQPVAPGATISPKKSFTPPLLPAGPVPPPPVPTTPRPRLTPDESARISSSKFNAQHATGEAAKNAALLATPTRPRSGAISISATPTIPINPVGAPVAQPATGPKKTFTPPLLPVQAQPAPAKTVVTSTGKEVKSALKKPGSKSEQKKSVKIGETSQEKTFAKDSAPNAPGQTRTVPTAGQAPTNPAAAAARPAPAQPAPVVPPTSRAPAQPSGGRFELAGSATTVGGKIKQTLTPKSVRDTKAMKQHASDVQNLDALLSRA